MKPIVRCLPLLWPYRRSVALLVILVLVNSALALLAPWPFKFLIDYSLGSGTPPEWLVGRLGAEGFRLRLLYACAATRAPRSPAC